MSIDISGLPTLCNFKFKHKKNRELSTRFVAEMLKRGFLAFRQFRPSLAHSDSDIEKYKTATRETFMLLSKLPPDKIIDSPVAHEGFQRLTKE